MFVVVTLMIVTRVHRVDKEIYKNINSANNNVILKLR